MVLVPNPGGSVSTSHENDMSPPTGLKPARMTGIYLHRGGPGRADTRGHDLFHGGNGDAPAAQSQATRRQPAVYQVADLLLRDSGYVRGKLASPDPGRGGPQVAGQHFV